MLLNSFADKQSQQLQVANNSNVCLIKICSMSETKNDELTFIYNFCDSSRQKSKTGLTWNDF